VPRLAGALSGAAVPPHRRGPSCALAVYELPGQERGGLGAGAEGAGLPVRWLRWGVVGSGLVEPVAFYGGGSVLLWRPHAGSVELLGDSVSHELSVSAHDG